MRGLNTGVLCNAINNAVVRSLLRFHQRGLEFTGDMAKAAASDKIRVRLGWRPQCDNLDTITAQALAWEAQLGELKHAS